MPDLLFIYGTLHPERAPREIADAAARLVPIGPATVRGHLFQLGEYPGVLLDPVAAPISGELFTVPDAATLHRLDWHEDFRPGDLAGSLFLRVETTATQPDGSQRSCWIYVYNGEPPSAVR